MKIKKFKDLNVEQLNTIVNLHYNYWVKFNPKMNIFDTENKFKNLYTKNTLPLGVAILDNEDIIGFCVIKKDNLKKYPHFTPWLSNLLIVERYRNNGYAKLLFEYCYKVLKELGYNKVYLWTDQASEYYKKIGYTYIQKVEKNEGGFGDLFCKEI